jgi:hypothetical protein
MLVRYCVILFLFAIIMWGLATSVYWAILWQFVICVWWCCFVVCWQLVVLIMIFLKQSCLVDGSRVWWCLTCFEFFWGRRVRSEFGLILLGYRPHSPVSIRPLVLLQQWWQILPELCVVCWMKDVHPVEQIYWAGLCPWPSWIGLLSYSSWTLVCFVCIIRPLSVVALLLQIAIVLLLWQF